MKKIIVQLLALLIIILSLRTAVHDTQRQNTNLSSLENQWQHSQYNLNQDKDFHGNMLDKDLYTYASLAYINGTDPSVLNFEHPPLAKYVIGIGYLLTGNIMYSQYIFYVLLLYITFHLTTKLLPEFYALIPLLLLARDPLISEYTTYVHLEFIQTVFILLTLLLLSHKKISTPKSILLGLTIGATMASKVFVTGLILMAFTLLFQSIKLSKDDQSSLKRVLLPNLLTLSSSLLLYLFSYSVTLYQRGFTYLITLHLEIIRFFKSYLPDYPWFEIWRILFLGQWRTWFGETQFQAVPSYWLAWPVAGVCLILMFVTKVTKYKSTKKPINQLTSQPINIILFWSLLYLLFQSTHVVFPNYLIQVLPLLYILTAVVFHRLLESIQQSFPKKK